MKEKGYMQKKNPILCEHCEKLFEGRNRAKIWQHVSSAEHRSKWAAANRRSEGAPIAESPDPSSIESSTKEVTTGERQGLRLNSSFGLKTRIGSDARLPKKNTTKGFSLQRGCQI